MHPKHPKYSVIIPVYNAEKTIHRCIDSLIADAKGKAEIILVNDGSKDASAEICQEYTKKYTNILFVNKENGGVSTARNAGLDIASGDYILFVDSDDYVAPDFFSAIDQTLEATPCDWIQFSYCFDDGYKKRDHLNTPRIAKSRAELMPYIIDAICRKQINPPWAKLYRRELIETNQIRFPVGASVGEDRVFNIKYSMYIKNYVVSDRMLYYISTENENSLTRGRHSDLKEQFQIADAYFQASLQEPSLLASEKDLYQRAYNFGDCRSIYHDAKIMHQDHIGWLQRQISLVKICRAINGKHMKYPQIRYCMLITLPVRLYLTPMIDATAWKLTR